MHTTSPRVLSTVFLLALVATPVAAAALLIEGDLNGKTLRILVDDTKSEAEVSLGETHHLVDLDAGGAQLIESDGTLGKQEVVREIGRAPMPVIKPWGPGPMVAGHASVYHVMMMGETICGELLISPWMKPFVSPAVEALAILERIKGDHDIKSATIDGPCGELPFSSYAAAGWPLMAGGVEHSLFETKTISFDYQPSEQELTRGGRDTQH
ncbi:MAG: hypothetical protein ACR2QF_01805 [Geminicoccaceae bacterium]